MLTEFSNQMADAVASAAPVGRAGQWRTAARERARLCRRRRADDDARRRAERTGPGAARRRPGAPGGPGRLGSGDAARGASRLRARRAANRARGGGAARRPPGARDRPVVEQRRHGHGRTGLGDWRAAGHRPPPLHRPRHPHVGADARRLLRRRVRRHRRRAPRRGDGDLDPRAGCRDSGRHGMGGGGDAAGARQPEARISWDRGPAGERPR